MFKTKKQQAALQAQTREKREADKRRYYDIGLSGTLEEFKAAFKDTVYASASYHLNVVGQQLRKGALDAFFEGRTEKLALMLADPASFSVTEEYGRGAPQEILGNIFSAFDESDYEYTHLVMLAYSKVPQEARQQAVDTALALMLRSNPDLRLIKCLLEQGANVNQAPKGSILAQAVSRSKPELVELLHEYGADFNEAIFLAKVNASAYSLTQENLNMLEAYRDKFFGAPSPTGDDGTHASRDELAEQVKALTAEVRALRAAFEASTKNAPEKPEAPSRPSTPPARPYLQF